MPLDAAPFYLLGIRAATGRCSGDMLHHISQTDGVPGLKKVEEPCSSGK